MDLLTDRVRDHFDKFISPILYEEMKNLEFKKTGRIDHSVNSHDDTIFSYLYSIYPLYYGKNIRENWHIDVPTLRTAQDEAQEIFQAFEATESVGIVQDIENLNNDEMIQAQFDKFNKDKLYQQFLQSQKEENEKAMQQILATKIGRQAYADKYNIPIDSIEANDTGFSMLSAINNFYSDSSDDSDNGSGTNFTIW